MLNLGFRDLGVTNERGEGGGGGDIINFTLFYFLSYFLLFQILKPNKLIDSQNNFSCIQDIFKSKKFFRSFKY